MSTTSSINDPLASEFPGLARADTGSVENTANRVTIRPLGLCTKFLSKLELTVLRRMVCANRFTSFSLHPQFWGGSHAGEFV